MFEGWGAAIAAGSAVVGAVSASNAADAQTDAANQANATSNAQYNQTRADMAPWRAAGETALGQLTDGTQPGGDYMRDFTLADFTKDPGYDFRMQEGQRAVDASAAARGGALSGAAIKGTERYGQNFASGEYQNAYNRFNTDRTQRFNRLSSIAGIGQTATRDVANLGAANAQTVAGNQIGVGNAQGGSAIATGNAVQGGLNSLGNWYMQRQYQQPNSSTAWAGGSFGGAGGGYSGWGQGITGNGATAGGDVLYG